MRPGRYPDGVAQSEAGILAIARSAARSSSWAPVRALWVAPPASDTLRWKSFNSSLERASIGQRCGDLQFTCVRPLIKVRSARRPCGCL